MLLRVALGVAVSIGVVAFLGLESGIWLLLVVAVTIVLLALGPNYFHPNSDD
jgi:uncharacterized membrane protein YccC